MWRDIQVPLQPMAKTLSDSFQQFLPQATAITCTLSHLKLHVNLANSIAMGYKFGYLKVATRVCPSCVRAYVAMYSDSQLSNGFTLNLQIS